MDVVIVGAGIGGLALANGLVRTGHRVTVLEAAAQLRTDGAAFTIFSNGHAALAGLGVPVPPLGGDIDELHFTLADGRPVSRVDLRGFARRTGFPVVTTPRERLARFLAEALPDGVIRYGRAVVDVTVVEGGAEVVDAADTRHRAALVVGADGARSMVRRRTLDAAPPRDVGWTTWQGLTPVLPELATGSTGLCVVGPAGLCGMMPAGAGLLQWWFDARTPEGEPAAPLDFVRSAFADYTDPVATLLASVRADDLTAFRHVTHSIPDAWGAGPTTLLGDAAHAFPPSQAQGANQALEDAWTLTRALRGDADPTAAARAYEQARAKTVRLVSKLATSEVTNRPPHPVARAMSRLVSPGAAGRFYLSAVRRYSTVLTAPDRPQPPPAAP